MTPVSVLLLFGLLLAATSIPLVLWLLIRTPVDNTGPPIPPLSSVNHMACWAVAWKRIARIHNTVAIITPNTITLCAVLLVLGDQLLPKGTIEWGSSINNIGISATYSGRFNQSHYYFMPPSDVRETLLEYDRMAAQGHWQVHPWTGLTMRRFSGRFLNIDANGHRLTTPPGPNFEDKSPLVIWAFGGSTLFGWGLADDYTLPSQLQAELQSRIPNRQVQVLNFAVPIYNSSQELALFAAYLRRMAQPDIVFFFDGVNDVWFVMYHNDPTPLIRPLADTWETDIELFTKANPSWITLNASFPLNRLMQQLGVNLNLSMKADAPFAFDTTGATTEQAQLDFAIDNYRANQRMATAIGDEFGVATYFFLQPWNDPYYPLFLQDVLHDNDHPRMYDLTNAFAEAGTTRSVFVDSLHYSDYGTQILARQVADILMATYPIGE